MKLAVIGDPHIGEKRFRKTIGGQNAWMLKGYQAWAEACSIAAENADAVLVAGDLFDRPNPTIQDIAAAQAGFDTIGSAGKTAYVILGNHDSSSIGRKEGFSPLGVLSGFIEPFAYEHGVMEIFDEVLLCCIPWFANCPETWSSIRRCKSSNLTKIMMHHGTVSSSNSWSDTSMDCMPESIASRWDWVISGHNHLPFERTLESGTRCITPGSIMPSSKAWTTPHDPSVCILNTRDGRINNIKIPSCPRCYSIWTTDPNMQLQQVQQGDVVQLQFPDHLAKQLDLQLVKQAHRLALHLHLAVEKQEKQKHLQELPFWEVVQKEHPEWFQEFNQIGKGLNNG